MLALASKADNKVTASHRRLFLGGSAAARSKAGGAEKTGALSAEKQVIGSLCVSCA